MPVAGVPETVIQGSKSVEEQDPVIALAHSINAYIARRIEPFPVASRLKALKLVDDYINKLYEGMDGGGI